MRKAFCLPCSNSISAHGMVGLKIMTTTSVLSSCWVQVISLYLRPPVPHCKRAPVLVFNAVLCVLETLVVGLTLMEEHNNATSLTVKAFIVGVVLERMTRGLLQ